MSDNTQYMHFLFITFNFHYNLLANVLNYWRFSELTLFIGFCY
jgi:hypothetical protein